MDASYFKLENLGLSGDEEKVLRDIVSHPTGLVLIVGPTGSGKTTTLYSLLNSLNSPEKKIITLEDPVEYNIPGITQIPVAGVLDDQNFAEKLRAVLRLDPDVVMVGEIRDQDTAKTALQGALTGHLVLSTFHAAGAAAALTRRLVRRLDDKTKQAYKPDEATASKIAEIINTLPPGIAKPDISNITLYKPGSSEANPFGFSGQMAIREQLMMTPGIQDILHLPPNKITTEELQAKAVSEGMKTMLQDGMLKVLAGQTTIEEIFRVVS
jgi:type II secretory ATPase GspE/PulE/Tfp pilus assembly ATPase PilB-like protein